MAAMVGTPNGPASGVGPDGEYLMNMHGRYDFGRFFGCRHRPAATHRRSPEDHGGFRRWQGRVVFGCDDTAITGGNRFVNQSQSNLCPGVGELAMAAARPAGAGLGARRRCRRDPSLPFHFAGYERRMVHLAHGSDQPVAVTIQVDRRGDGRWSDYATIAVPAGGYA